MQLETHTPIDRLIDTLHDLEDRYYND